MDETNPIIEHPLERAARLLGSQVALANALGVTKAAVGQWKDPGRRVPAEHCPVIEQLTAGAVRCEELRPDVQWGVLREPVTPEAVGDGA
jgi:DNA-binding transcriptional regulator YdaS (Cro superfamily)